jgi:hypothetical protein
MDHSEIAVTLVDVYRAGFHAHAASLAAVLTHRLHISGPHVDDPGHERKLILTAWDQMADMPAGWWGWW